MFGLVFKRCPGSSISLKGYVLALWKVRGETKGGDRKHAPRANGGSQANGARSSGPEDAVEAKDVVDLVQTKTQGEVTTPLGDLASDLAAAVARLAEATDAADIVKCAGAQPETTKQVDVTPTKTRSANAATMRRQSRMRDVGE